MLYNLISQYIMLCYIKFYTIIHIISYHCYFQVRAPYSPFMGSRQLLRSAYRGQLYT